MHVLLNPFSLPQRLVRKALYQPVLGVLIVAILVIWTIGCLLESKAIPVEFTTTELNTETLWMVNTNSLKMTATSFVKSRRNQIHDSVIEYLNTSFYRSCHDAISSWNRSLSTSVHAQKIMYGYMLGLNGTITNVLYNKSKQFNESLDNLGISGANQLGPNYWFIGELFKDAAINNTKLDDLKLNFPLISNFTRLNLPNVNVNSFVSNVHRISNQSNQIPEKNSDMSKVQQDKFPIDLKSHCKILTAIMIVAYFVCMVAICIYEWLKFRWERLIFNNHVDLYLHPLEKEKEGPIKSQQRSYQFFRRLVFTMNNTPLYWISNWMGARKTKEGVRWNRLVNFQWWAWSNTGYFLLILMAVIFHWQICVSMVHNYSNQLTTFENSHQNSTHNTTKIVTDGTQFYHEFAEECQKFEIHMLRIFNDSIFNQLWSNNGTMITTLNHVNQQMNRLVREVEVAAPPEWNNLTLSNFVYPQLPFSISDYNSTSNSLALQCFKNKAVSRRRTTTSSIISTSTSYSASLPQGPMTTELHKWFIIAVVTTMTVFYAVGFGVFTKI